ncbi:MAG: DUF2079 domain-containing protein [Patescibacteria group bacterium]
MKRVFILCIALYTIVFSCISLWKYNGLRYNARDLAIYNQILWQLQDTRNEKQDTNIVDNFYSSIQGHNYLGDHVEPILLLIAPLYALFPDPRTVLIIQTLALALAAIPLFLITKIVLAASVSRQEHGSMAPWLHAWLPPCVGVLWLLHPAVQNANLFEFHSLAFAPLVLFFLFWAHLKVQANALHPSLFILFLLLSLSVREDVALITFPLGFIWMVEIWYRRGDGTISARGLSEQLPTSHDRDEGACRDGAEGMRVPQKEIEPRRAAVVGWILSLLTIAISSTWFLLAQHLIARFSPSGGYQFRGYYEWILQLGSWGATFKGVMAHLFTLPNLEMLIGLLLPLLFLPLLKPTWLLLSLPPLAAIVFSQSGGGALIWQTHYGLLLLPGIFLACIDSLKKKSILFVALITASLSAALAFGPLTPALRAVTSRDRKLAPRNLISAVPPSASIAATDRFLAPLSSRRGLTLLPLLLLGVQQYAAAPYASVLPNYILLDQEEVWADLIQAQTLAWTSPYASHMAPQFRHILSEGKYGIVKRQDGALLMIRGEGSLKIPPFTFEERDFKGVQGGLELDRLGSVRFIIDDH